MTRWGKAESHIVETAIDVNVASVLLGLSTHARMWRDRGEGRDMQGMAG